VWPKTNIHAITHSSLHKNFHFAIAICITTSIHLDIHSLSSNLNLKIFTPHDIIATYTCLFIPILFQFDGDVQALNPHLY
jgi:hypothetical protein